MYRIDENVWQGGYPKKLPEGCTAIINLCPNGEKPCNYPKLKRKVHVYLPIYDGLSPGLKWLEMAVGIMKALIKGGHVVYVHCRAGWSRSVMLVCAYLIDKYNLTVAGAIDKVSLINSEADPARSFVSLLAEYKSLVSPEFSPESLAS